MATPPRRPGRSLKDRDLTVNKVIAAAGAAATSAVLGSFFGAMGTIGGAAIGSVVSMLTTSIFEHSLDRTRDTVKAASKLPGGRTVQVEGPVEVPPPMAPEGESVRRRSTSRRVTSRPRCSPWCP